jgi:hypothetical protein
VILSTVISSLVSSDFVRHDCFISDFYLFKKLKEYKAVPYETREGWPLLTVETEANGNSWRTHGRGPSLVGSLGSYRAVTRDFCSALAAL